MTGGIVIICMGALAVLVVALVYILFLGRPDRAHFVPRERPLSSLPELDVDLNDPDNMADTVA